MANKEISPPVGSAKGYYPVVVIPPDLHAPQLEALLYTLAVQPVFGIDPQAQGALPIEETCHQVVDRLVDPNDGARTKRRFIALALTMALATQSWMRRYTPTDSKGTVLTDAAVNWLKTGAPYSGLVGEALYPMVATRHQHLDESREVHRCLSRMLTVQEADRQQLLDILDVTLDGYAVFPGFQARRDLFNWWLSEAVPASYLEQVPDWIYSGDWPWPPRR